MAGAYVGFLERNSWKIGDWLINYQGGMIRRGFLGEVIYLISLNTRLNPGFLVFLMQTIFYGLFFYFSYLLLVIQKNLLPFILLIFSPFLFTFQIYDFQGGYRKEIIYFALLAVLTWVARRKSKKTSETVFYLSLLVYPLLILSHEMLVFYLPYLLIIFFSVFDLDKKRLLNISILLIPSLISFAACLYYSGTSQQISNISESLIKMDYQIILGSIAWLDKTTDYAIQQVLLAIKNKQYFFYLLTLVFSLGAFVPVIKRFKHIIKNKLLLLLFLASIIASVTLFVVALDWGRFIYIHLVSWFFISLMSKGNSQSKSSNEVQTEMKTIQDFSIIKAPLLFLFVIFYAFSWHIPYCCKPIPYPQNISNSNIFLLLVPYKRLALRLNM